MKEYKYHITCYTPKERKQLLDIIQRHGAEIELNLMDHEVPPASKDFYYYNTIVFICTSEVYDAIIDEWLKEEVV